jgi:subtilisin family serine protease
MTCRRLSSVFILTLLLLFLPIGLIPPAARATDPASPDPQAGGSPFSTTPDRLTATIPMGERQQVALEITNGGTVSLTPRLYEAQSAPPVGAVSRRVVPQELRRVALPNQAERIDTQLTRDLDASADGQTEFLVFLKDQPDLSGAYRIADWNARGQYVYETLLQHAARSQQPLRDWLDARGLEYQPFWIANAIAVEGSAADVQALAGRAEVALLRANRVSRLDNAGSTDTSTFSSYPATAPKQFAPNLTVPSACDPDAQGICWNIRKIAADRVWNEFGIDGAGITVASIDSGVSYNHQALLPQYRGYDTSGSIEHTYNWFDPQDPLSEPFDAGNHGTHTMGTMVGNGDGTDAQPAIGVAPGAAWIAARGCEKTFCSEAALIAAAEWLLNPTDPDGKNPRPDLRPQVINNSWADSVGGNDQYAGYTTAWRAAGIFPVFAAGNGNNATCSTVASPGDYSNVVGVGATNKNDEIASFSSIGPSLDGDLKPDISAPGQGIVSTFAGSDTSYGSLQGTSMAAPHVAATVALLWSANPALISDYDATYAILAESAIGSTDSSFTGSQYANCPADTIPNNIYGYGVLNAYAAVAAATVDVPWLELPAGLPNITPGASETISVTLDAGRVSEPGEYQARLLLHTDNLSQTPLMVEVDLTVTPVDPQVIITGSLSDNETGMPITGTVTVSGGPTVPVNSSGNFTITLKTRSEPYTLTAGAPGYLSQTIEVAAQAGTVSTPLFALVADLPRMVAETDPLTATLAFGEVAEFAVTVANTGTQPLDYTLEVPPEQYGIWRSDETDGPASTWIDLPPGTTTALELADNATSDELPLGFDFPFYGNFYDEVYLSANGVVTFNPQSDPDPIEFDRACLPVPESFSRAIVPLRTNLDPSQGGTIRYGTVAAGFVILFESVPRHGEPDQRFTFQIVLARDGRIMFNYGQLDMLPADVAVGIQHRSRDIQKIGCGQSTPIADGLTIEWRPQTNPQFWVELPEDSGNIAAGTEEEVSIMLDWVMPTQQQPYRSAVLLRSNDPYQPVIRLPVELTTLEAPYQLHMPIVAR